MTPDTEARHIQRLLTATATPPTREVDPAKLRRRAHRRTRRAQAAGGAGLIVVVAMAVAVWPTMTSTPIIDEGAPLTERAPAAGVEPDHWPIELVYTPSGASTGDSHVLRFRGNSWADWSLEAIDPGTDEARLVDRQHPGRDFEPEAGAFLDEPHELVDERGVGPELFAGWRDAVGLGERVVVPVVEVPGGQELIAALGLDGDEVEAYTTPNIAGCTEPLDICAPGDADAARAIAHRETGFPLFAEERYGGEQAAWLTAHSFTYRDPSISPVPIEDIPTQ